MISNSDYYLEQARKSSVNSVSNPPILLVRKVYNLASSLFYTSRNEVLTFEMIKKGGSGLVSGEGGEREVIQARETLLSAVMSSTNELLL